MKPSQCLLICSIFVGLSSISCTTSQPIIEYGMVNKHLGYVPARIAVLPCTKWPAAAQYKNLPLSNAKTKVSSELCMKFDKFVIGGFKDQPYMNGYTPRAIGKLLKKANQESLLSSFDSSWKHQATDCKECKNAPTYYHNSIANRKEWQSWLNNFSNATRNSDAILAPFSLFLKQEKVNERGLLSSRIAGGILMVLIDTNNGDLLWSNARILEEANQVIENKSKSTNPEYPAWSVIFERLLNSSMWREFPGRLVF